MPDEPRPPEPARPAAEHRDHALYFHTRVDPHRHGSRLSDVILGGQDGIVNVLGVILGVAAATEDARIVLAAGLAATFAESFSMAAVAYTSTQTDRAHYEAELQREHRHIDHVPHLEREEVRQIYRRKGFEGPLLERIVDTITADRDVWVAVMMSEELKLAPVERHGALRAAAVVGFSAIVGSLIPLAPFLILGVHPAIWAAMAVSGLTLFAAGAYKAATTVGSWSRSAIEMTVIGMGSALVGYLIGLLFRVPPGGGG